MSITFNGTFTTTRILSDPSIDNPVAVSSTGLIDVNSPTAYTPGILGPSGFAWTVTNVGTVESTGSQGLGIDLLSGGVVTNGLAGLIAGSDAGIDMSGGSGTVSNLGTVSAGNFGVYIRDGIGTVSNLGTMSASGNAVAGGIGVALKGGGSMTNGPTGLIATLSDGVFIAGGIGTVSNLGTLSASSGTGHGVLLYAGGRVTNGSTGSIASGGDGVYIKGGIGAVSNLGMLSAGVGDAGIALKSGGSATNGLTGVIEAGNNGNGVYITGGIGTVSNLGMVSAPGVGVAAGIRLEGGGSVTNGSSGLIVSGQYGVYITGGIGTVSNLGAVGAVVGIHLESSGSVTNGSTGYIGSGAAAVYIGGGSNSSVSNLGTLSASFGTGDGVSLFSFSSRVTNGASGSIDASITGGSDGVLVRSPVGTVTNFGIISGGSIGVELQGGGSVNNNRYGLVAGELGISITGGAGTVIDSGVVSGNGGTAVSFGAGDDTLILDPTAVMFGKIDGGTGNNTLELRTGVTSGRVTGVVKFGHVNVDTGANWMLGVVGLASGQTLHGSGGANRLVFETAGTIDLSGVYGFPTIVLANSGGANSTSLHDLNFTRLSSPVIAVNGGDFGNTVDASALTGANRVVLNGGARADHLTGGAGGDTLNGGGGNDTLNGRVGADTMAGGGGNDTYVVDNVGDVVSEAAASGTDTVKTTLSSYTLGANVENLTYTGSGNFTGTGNSLNNAITGGPGSDTLNGGAGNDKLTGGAGSDSFRFDTALSATTNVDRIFDFSSVNDKILLSHLVFTQAGPLGTLASAAFHTGSAAADADDRIVYNSASGALIYDANGNASGGATQFATLATGLALTHSNFTIV